MSDRRRLGIDLVTVICSLGVGIVFLYASLDKIQHPGAFAQAIANYRMVPMVLLHPFAWVLPIAEAVVGLALIVGWQRRGAALLAALMTVMFIIAIASALARGLDISCGCFDTAAGHGVGLDLLLRDVVLLAAALVPLLVPRGRWTLDAWLGRGR
jgi:putative oxidoreductase